MLQDFIKEKAREISYALIRVAFYIKHQDLRSRVEGLAFELLDDAAKVSVENTQQSITSVLSTIASLDVLIRLAHSIYEVEPVNATIIVRELNELNSAIRQYGKMDERLPDLESLFSSTHARDEVAVSVNNRERFEENNGTALSVVNAKENTDKSKINLSDLSRIDSDNNQYAQSPQSSSIVNRQSAIVDKIKSANGSGCRLKDVLAGFPDVSERTLRYDLQRLCERGIIARIGNGGPATYYRIA